MMPVENRTPCVALEWDWLSGPLDLDLTNTGDFDTTATRATVQRTPSYGIAVTVMGKGGFSSPAHELRLRKGEMLPPLRPLSGTHVHTDSVHALRTDATLEGLTEEGRTISGADSLRISASANSMAVTVTLPDPQADECGVEWLLNFDTDPALLPGATDRSFGEVFTRLRSTSQLTLPFKAARRSRAMTNDHLVLRLRIDGREWTLTVGRPEPGHCATDLKPGFVEYRAADGSLPDQATRELVVTALSFALGRHLIPVGWTVFDTHGRPTRATSHRAHILGRDETFSNPSMPPCPLAPDGSPLVDPEATRAVTQAVLDLFQRGVDIEFPVWLTWLARSSPLDACAAHYGAAIEALRSRFFSTRASGSTTLLPSADWKAVRPALDAALDTAIKALPAAPSAQVFTMLRNNLRGINNKSSGARYPEFFELLGLPVDKVENAALRERNKPAHGTEYEPSQYAGLKATVDALQTLFNRVMLKLAQCDRAYIDYSTYGHPVRRLSEPLGGPNGDRKAAGV